MQNPTGAKSPAYGEMYFDDNSTETVIDTADVTHLFAGVMSAGANLHFDFVTGTSGTDITAMATYDSGASTLITTTAVHNLVAGQYISITGTTNYNELYKVLSAPSTTTFEINKAWDTNDDATGTYTRGDALIANGNSAGDYSGDHYISSVASANNNVFLTYTVANGVKCPKCIVKRNYAVGADYGTVAGHALATNLVAGTTIQYGVENVGATGNITVEFGNLRVVRI